MDLNALSANKASSPLYRVIVVGTDEWTRCFLRKDQVMAGDERPARVFANCEKFVLKLASSNTILVETQGSIFR